MQDLLNQILVGGVYSFFIVFIRLGAALATMPVFGDFFITTRIRLAFAVGFSLVLTPVLQGTLPPQPTNVIDFSILIGQEFIIGAFIGSIARFLISALDTAGMIISFKSGLSNAQIFNPSLGGQGSLVGAFLSITGIMFLFATNMHHFLIVTLTESYAYFPVGTLPPSGSMAELLSTVLSRSFEIAFKLSMPFVIVALMIFVTMGIMARVMPQVQIFLIALPGQVGVAFLTLALTISAILYYWVDQFEAGLGYFLTQAVG